MVHLDRPLVNPLEVTFAPAVPSHLLTQQFLTYSDATKTAIKQGHVAPWTPELAGGTTVNFAAGTVSNTPNVVAAESAALYRALELLTVKPWTYGMPNYGKVAGKINVNLITDPRVLMALADPQAGNSFTAADVYNPAQWDDPKTVFGRLTLARGGAAPVYQTVYNPDPSGVMPNQVRVQVPGPADTPIRSFGTAGNSTLDPGYFPNSTSLGLPSTAARTVNAGGVNAGVFTVPFQTQPYLPTAQAHPYLQQELLRKIQNNLTTTTDTFAVYITVGFFEVTNTPNSSTDATAVRPQLGKELFKDMPGDFRQRYFAVVDRSNLSLDPSDPNLQTQGGKPVMTQLASSLPAIDTATGTGTAATIQVVVSSKSSSPVVQVAYEGAVFSLVPSAQHNPYQGMLGYLRIGSGSAAEWVQINTVTPPVNDSGIATLSVNRNVMPPGGNAKLLLFNPNNPDPGHITPIAAHNVGDVVTNVIPGNPGPQSAFNPRAVNYQSVVPYFVKIE
jgi:hypothetical protein